MESAKPSVYTNGNKEGKDRVIKDDGAYAFFMEAAALQYYMERDCELTQIGGLLDNKGYGVGLPPGKHNNYYAEEKDFILGKLKLAPYDGPFHLSRFFQILLTLKQSPMEFCNYKKKEF